MTKLAWLLAGSKEHLAAGHRVQSVREGEIGLIRVKSETKEARMMARAHASMLGYRDCAPWRTASHLDMHAKEQL